MTSTVCIFVSSCFTDGWRRYLTLKLQNQLGLISELEADDMSNLALETFGFFRLFYSSVFKTIKS